MKQGDRIIRVERHHRPPHHLSERKRF